MNLASTFYGYPNMFLLDLPVLRQIECLHLTNTWVAKLSLFIGLQELSQLTHLSFHVRPPGQMTTHTVVLSMILELFQKLQVIVLWQMEYQESHDIYNHLKENNLTNHRIVVFNAIQFAEFVQSMNGVWAFAEQVVQWRKDNQGMELCGESFV